MDQQAQTDIKLERPVTERLRWERDQKTCIVEIDCRVGLQVIPESGCIAPMGVHRFQVPRSVLPLITGPDYLRTDEDRAFYAKATETFERELGYVIDDDDLVKDSRRSGDEEELKKRIRDIRLTYPGSPEAVLCRDYRRNWPPFERVTVIEDNLPNPVDVARIAEENDRAAFEKALRSEEVATTASAVAAAVAQALAPLVASLQSSQSNKKGG